MRMPRAHGCAAFAAALLALTPATGVADMPAADQIAQLNALREANGFPAGLVENPDWSRACTELTSVFAGDAALTHILDPTREGYTPAADFAARSSVLARGSGWAVANPWQNAPFHLMQLLAPQLSAVGAADGGGVQCMTTWPGFSRRAADDALYGYPGAGTVVEAGYVALEAPVTPAGHVGLGPDAMTGPNLIVLADGPWVEHERGELNRITAVTDAQLLGPDGPVDLRVISPTDPGVGPLMPDGAIVVPTAPLRAGQTYLASVEMENGLGTRLRQTWNFATASVPNHLELAEVSWRIHGGQMAVRVAVTTDADAPTVRVQRGDEVHDFPLGRSGVFWQKDEIVVPAGAWTVCAHSGGDRGPYGRASSCVDIGLG